MICCNVPFYVILMCVRFVFSMLICSAAPYERCQSGLAKNPVQTLVSNLGCVVKHAGVIQSGQILDSQPVSPQNVVERADQGQG